MFVKTSSFWQEHDWYLKEWLAETDKSVTWLEEETGWTHRIASQLVNRRIRWNRDHLNAAAMALGVPPHELLMHPNEAMKLRRMRDTAISIAAESRQDWQGPEPTEPSGRLKPSKRK